ncbi:MAG: hypothetical protein IH623_16330 [Verrucomicrobia bacterium]|nr:hypothetical protein [Verrucomicrobiota bacterium]
MNLPSERGQLCPRELNGRNSRTRLSALLRFTVPLRDSEIVEAPHLPERRFPTRREPAFAHQPAGSGDRRSHRGSGVQTAKGRFGKISP